MVMVASAAKTNAGLAVSIFGWIVIAFAIHNPGIPLEMLNLATIVIGFCLLVGGLLMMLRVER
jgi:hypothetical protein